MNLQWKLIAILMLLVSFTISEELKDTEETSTEDLPEPEAFRQRPLVATNHRVGNKPDQLGSASNSYGSYGGATEYGGYASESGYGGYGLACATGYVNASAVALLAFLFLLNLVQDIIQAITATPPAGGRKKREQNALYQFISDGGLSALKEGLPEIVLPTMVELVSDQGHPDCLKKSLCEANFKLSKRYGVVGKVVATLLSNVLAKAFTGEDIEKFRSALKGAAKGRQLENCSQLYPSCSYHHLYTSEANGRATNTSQETDKIDNASQATDRATNTLEDKYNTRISSLPEVSSKGTNVTKDENKFIEELINSDKLIKWNYKQNMKSKEKVLGGREFDLFY